MRNSSTKIQKVDVDEDKTSETSETPKQIINELHTIRQYTMEYGCSARRGHPHVCLCLYSAEIRGQHRCTPGEIDALAEAHMHVTEDGQTLHVAFPSLYEHVGNRNLRLQTRDTVAATAAATTTATTICN